MTRQLGCFETIVFYSVRNFCIYLEARHKKKLRGFGLLANYADRATAASWRSSANFCG
jgi:hypothetical protein